LLLQVVMQFLHGLLVGEGNVGRHLELLGYKPGQISSCATDIHSPPPLLFVWLQVVMQFLLGRLVGEGNVGRHLELLGCKLA
jgi:hypothetical protein